MPTETKNMEFRSEIRKLIGTEQLVIGTERVFKLLKTGKLAKVFVSSNVPGPVKDDLDYYSKLSETDLVDLSLPNDELGILCRKPFSISILGVMK